MPCTVPKPRLTATTPPSTPVTTGSVATASALNEANAASSSTLITTAPAMARRCTSLSMRARLSTENTGAPLICSVSPLAACGAKASRAPAMAAAAPSMSAPVALMVAISNARGASRATHTPCAVLGERDGISDSAMRCVSPLGSRSSRGRMALPAGVPSSEVASAMASRRPSAVKRCASTAGLSW